MSELPLTLTRRRLRAEEQRASEREALLDAAGELIRTRTWSEVSMADVSTLAGVNRGAIYKLFGSRSVLTRALAARETSRLTDRVERALAEHRTSPTDALRAAFAVLTAPSERPLLAALILGPRAESALAPRLGAAPLLRDPATRLARALLNTWPSLGPADAHQLSDALARLAVSYHRLPASSRTLSGDSLAVMLGAFLEDRLRHRGEH